MMRTNQGPAHSGVSRGTRPTYRNGSVEVQCESRKSSDTKPKLLTPMATPAARSARQVAAARQNKPRPRPGAAVRRVAVAERAVIGAADSDGHAWVPPCDISAAFPPSRQRGARQRPRFRGPHTRWRACPRLSAPQLGPLCSRRMTRPCWERFPSYSRWFPAHR
jgi:hypothetical protein